MPENLYKLLTRFFPQPGIVNCKTFNLRRKVLSKFNKKMLSNPLINVN